MTLFVKMQCSGLNLVSCVLVGVVLSITCSNASIPDFIKFCRDPSSDDCLRESIQATLPGFIQGSPEIGTEVLDPFVVDNLNLTLPGGVTISFKQGLATGFRKCVIDKARMVNDNMEVQLHCSLTIRGKYRSTGRLLMFPIDGEGDSNIRCKNLRLAALIKLGYTNKNSQEHLVIKNVKLEHRFEGRVSYQLTNLFRGSPEMSNMVLEFMNRNWKLVAEEFGKPIVDYGLASIMRNLKQLLDAVPIKDLVRGPLHF